MVDIQEILEYFGKYSKFTNLPSYSSLAEGLTVSGKTKIETVGGNKFITHLEIEPSALEETVSNVRRIASHLWGGRDTNPEIMGQLEILSIERIDYADREPLKFTVQFPGGVKRTFFAKPFEPEDVGRVFGLELEHLLSPHKFEYSFGGQAIYEDGIPGIEAEVFLDTAGAEAVSNLAYYEELVRLDYRCQVMLLGDMHSSNFLVRAINGKDGMEYEVRAIDFNQLFNIPYIEARGELGTAVFSDSHISKEKAISILGKERYNSVIALERERLRKRFLENRERINDLLPIIGYSDHCNQYLEELRTGLAKYHNDNTFLDAEKVADVGDVLKLHLQKELIDKK